MKISIYENYEEMSRNTAAVIADFINSKPDALLCFPSGDTPLKAFQYLVEMSRSGQVVFSGCTFVGLDEWVGLDRLDDGSCKGFIYDHLFVPLGIDESRIQFFDAKAPDIEAECVRIDQFIALNGPIDLMYLGLGMNGHIGLNEPGSDFSAAAHIVKLDETTRSVGQKYFHQQTRLEQGITLGIRQVMESRMVLLGVSGAKKAEIVKQAAQGEVTNKVPGSVLQKHGNSVLILDRDAAARLEGPV